jgi:DNA primase small subunit
MEAMEIEETVLTELSPNVVANTSQNEGIQIEGITPTKTETNIPLAKAKVITQTVDNPETKIYYENFFPFNLLERWLSYGNTATSKNPLDDKTFFSRREISLTLQNEAYMRYQTFTDAEKLKKDVVKWNPQKLDIGAVFNINPKMHNFASDEDIDFHPEQREFILDIDMDAYNDVRTCCQGKSVCKKCWKFILAACHVLNDSLKDDFGFEHSVWIFSGRRGIHAWVCDLKAREMKADARASVVDYLSLITGGDKSDSKVTPFDTIHPHIARSVKKLEKFFVDVIVEEQGLFKDRTQFEKFLQILTNKIILGSNRDRAYQTLLENKNGLSPETVLKTLKGYLRDDEENCTRNASKFGPKKKITPLYLYEEVILNYLYPRIDSAVSKPLNHLLKSPFCIHPSTGKVSVPLLFEELIAFDPDTAVTLKDLLECHYEGKITPKLTAFNKHVKIFENFIEECIKHEKNNRLIKRQEEMKLNEVMEF